MSEEKQSLPQIEEEILKFWKEHKIFEKSISSHKNAAPFRFYEGPPTANAGPGFHHVISRVYKDIICRYKTMAGFLVERKAGWDTHGLPVELQIEKELGIKHKSEIEKFGIAEFNKKAKDSVWRFKGEWEKFTERIGYWLDLNHPYITYDLSYMETVWWILKEFWKKNLLEEDYKVVPWCPRCETPLSSHEVAQGYKNVRDPSIYVRLKIKNSKNKHPEYLLVWTTTPWTLPANAAVAVNPAVTYTKYKIAGEFYWSATTPPMYSTDGVEVIEKRSGKSLVGLEYEPIFQLSVASRQLSGKSNRKPKAENRKLYTVVPGSFVLTEEGTGFVHIAPAFGEDDLNVGKKEGLPVILNVSGEGKFNFSKEDLKREPFLKKIQNVFVKEADPIILKELERQKILYKGDPKGTEHEYPFCWRCGTPLLYYATKSWFIKMSAIKKEVIANNEKVNWIPAHLKEGRFGEWLRELKDWSLSRERYWGTPLPIWRCEKKGCFETVGSLKELNSAVYKPNTFYIMRHGEGIQNVKKYNAAWPEPKGKEAHLTKTGRAEVAVAAKTLAKKKIDMIFASDMVRIKETVAILKKHWPKAEVHYDSRLREINSGIFNYRPPKDQLNFFDSLLEKFTKRPPGGENLNDVLQRYFEVWHELNLKYRGKKILIVGHGDPLWVFEGKVRGLKPEQILKLSYIDLAEWRELPQNDLPYNEEAEVDLHRPYIDSLLLECKNCHAPMRRVKDVIDVWFDAGSMPFSQWHYPFENRERVDKHLSFPADYIAEAIDQTRGWFYTLLAISTALGRGPAYLNAVSVGHVLDEKGEKMSKSKGNIVNPWDMISKYGADSLRWYFFTVNPPGEPKRFAERDLAKSHQNLMVLENVLNFWELYAPRKIDLARISKRTILDSWILAKLSILIKETEAHMEKYEIVEAGRKIENFFLEDLSRWYVRRSRRRMQKPENEKELLVTSATLGKVLLELSKLMAPFTPFLSEHVWQKVSARVKSRKSKSIASVHLEKLPKPMIIPKAETLLIEVEALREIASLLLRLRAEAGIKVRQPLLSAEILEMKDSVRLSKEFLDILAEEINLKKIKMVSKLSEEKNFKILSEGRWHVALDTEITGELKNEALMREFIRAIQEARHDMGLEPKDRIYIFLDAPQQFSLILERYRIMVMKEVGAEELRLSRTDKFDLEREAKIEEHPIWFAIRKK